MIIEEAGGVIGTTIGEAIMLDGGCSILAGTPKAVDEIKVILRKC